MDFHIPIDQSFLELWSNADLQPVSNKHLVSILNDFEDGAWRHEKFQNFVWDNVAETALSHREREALGTHPSSLLTRAAKNLRLTDADEDIGKGSEVAEIVLYGIMKHKYGALSVVPKIFYKQNSQDNAKGADSVHIVLEPDGGFSLWFGEAKFYSDIDDSRLAKIVDSIKTALATDKLKKENSIITSVSDLDDIDIDPALRESIKNALSHKTSIDNLKGKIHVPILVLHECAITALATSLSQGYLDAMRGYHLDRAFAYFKKQIEHLGTIHKYSEIRFHLILFPVPSKQGIVDQFISKAQSFRG